MSDEPENQIPELPPGWHLRLLSDQGDAQPAAKRWNCRLYQGSWNQMDKNAPNAFGTTMRDAVFKAIAAIRR